MSEGRQRSEWMRTAELLAMLANCHRGKNSRVLKGSDFNPFRDKRQQQQRATFGDLEKVLTDKPRK